MNMKKWNMAFLTLKNAFLTVHLHRKHEIAKNHLRQSPQKARPSHPLTLALRLGLIDRESESNIVSSI